MSEDKFNNVNVTKSLNDEIFFYAEPLSPEKLKQPLKDKKIYVKVVFYNKDKKEIYVDEPNNVKVRDVIKEDVEFFAKKNFEYNQDIIISHKFNIKDFLMSKGFKERKDIENEERKYLEDVKYISCWIDANNDNEVSIDYDEEVVVEIGNCEIMFSKISAIVLKNEGGFVNNPNDKGGATNHGITWNTWQKYSKSDLGIEPTLENLKNLSDKNAEKIYFKRYWEPKGFCKIKDIKVALMIYDWTITSGGAIRQIQKLLNSPKYNNNLSIDNGLGENTINAINNVSKQDVLLNDIATIRKKYYYDLSYDEKGNPKIDKFGRNQSVFYKGWINRVNTVLGVKF